ncbi:MAG: hypothetical protein AAF492_04425 [Verrucomicrobiota bacterium]
MRKTLNDHTGKSLDRFAVTSAISPDEKGEVIFSGIVTDVGTRLSALYRDTPSNSEVQREALKKTIVECLQQQEDVILKQDDLGVCHVPHLIRQTVVAGLKGS